MTRRSMRLVDEAQCGAIEDYLEMTPGAHALKSMYIEDIYLENAGRRLELMNLVKASVEEHAHPMNFVAGTLLGSKFVVNDIHEVAVGDDFCFPCYDTGQYGCCGKR